MFFSLNKLLILLVILQISCKPKNELNTKLDFSSKKIQVHAILDSYKESEHHLGYSTLIYAKVIIKNTSKDSLEFDLTNLKIKVDSLYSSSIFIDTIGDVIIKERKIRQDEIVEYKIYWSFLNENPNLQSGEIKLFYDYPSSASMLK